MTINTDILAKAVQTESRSAADTEALRTESIIAITEVLDKHGVTPTKALTTAFSYTQLLLEQASNMYNKAAAKHKRLDDTATFNMFAREYIKRCVSTLPQDLASIERKKTDAKAGISRSMSSDRKTVKHEAIGPARGGSFNGGGSNG